MAMVRMFHMSCDICFTEIDHDEWYAALAIQAAKADGWHVAQSKQAICDTCWDEGKRWKDLP